MIGRAAEHPARQLGPRFERVPALEEVGQRGRQLPHPAHAVAGSRRDEGHLLEVLRLRLKIKQPGRRRDRVPERRMARVIVDGLTVDKNAAAVAQALDVLPAVLDHRGSWLPAAPVARRERERVSIVENISKR